MAMFRNFSRPMSSTMNRLRKLSTIQEITPFRNALSGSDLEQFDFLSDSILPKIRNHIAKNSEESTPIRIQKTFDEIKSELTNPVHLPNEPISNESLSNEVDLLLKYSPRSGKSRFVDKLYSGSDGITQFATFLLSVLNNNSHTFNSSQILSVVEDVTIKNLCKVFYKSDDSPRGGVFMPGGAYSNMMAFRLARDKYHPSILSDGTANTVPIVLTSDQSHYSVATAVGQLGIGTNNVRKLETNSDGTINIDNCRQVVEELIKVDSKPFILSCNAGSTVLGAFDDFKALSAICREFDIWMHVDGCWGGGSAFARETNPAMGELVDGIELADSISFDSHKLLSTGLLCGCLLVKDESYLYKSCQPPNAKYLFHGNDGDIGLKTLQCGRQCDALKLYLSWIYYGKEGLIQRVDNAMNNAQHLCKLIEESDDFLLYEDPKFCNICFWYVGKENMQKVKKWKEGGFVGDDGEIFEMLEKNTKRTSLKMEQDGSSMVDYSPYKNLPVFFRLISSNFKLTTNEVERILSDIRYSAETSV